MKIKLYSLPFAALLLVTGTASAADRVITSVEALACNVSMTADAPQDCPYPSDVEKHDAAFREDIARAMKNAGLEAEWAAKGTLRGPETPLEPVLLSGVTWLKGSACEQHNCAAHRLDYLYQPYTHGFVAVYHQGDKSRLIGKPDAQQLSLLKQN